MQAESVSLRYTGPSIKCRKPIRHISQDSLIILAAASFKPRKTGLYLKRTYVIVLDSDARLPKPLVRK